MAKQRLPDEFGDILHSPEKPLIVGGQAVNLWAYYYSFADAQLAQLQPFMSKDADILGDRALVEKLARVPGWKVRYYNEPRQTAVALLWKESKGEDDLIVEVLRSVKGLGPKDVVDSTEIEIEPGKIYRVPSPIRMMKAKLANLTEIRPMRDQDLRHVQLLVPICRHYLNEQLQRVHDGELSERAWINAYHELRAITDRSAARAADKQHGLALGTAFPVAASAVGLPKIMRLYAGVDSPRVRSPRQPS